MGSDCHQILALSTMFTKDIFDYYGGRKRFGEKGTVYMGRAFIIVANGIAYIVALFRPPIFELAVQYAFSGFAARRRSCIAALFWRRSTKWGGAVRERVCSGGVRHGNGIARSALQTDNASGRRTFTSWGTGFCFGTSRAS